MQLISRTQLGNHHRADALIASFVLSDYNRRLIEGGEDWQDHCAVLVEWFRSEFVGVASIGTVNRYRYLISAYLQYQGLDSLAAEFKESLAQPRTRRLTKGPSRKAIESERGIKTSKLEKADYVQLLQRLLSTTATGRPRYQYGALIVSWIRMIMMTGVRPSEFRGADLIDDLISSSGTVYGLVLSVVGARKGANDKSSESDRVRYLDLHRWEAGDVDELLTLLRALPVEKKEFDDLLNSVQQSIAKANRAVFGARNEITLYSGRHLYAAEFRRGGYGSKYGLAAALGHSDVINQRYYGDYEELGERQFAFPLALPISEAIHIVYDTARRRHQRTLARIHNRFGKRPKPMAPTTDFSQW